MQAKYYPPDFDPSLVPRAKKKRQNEDAVRFMLPMSVRCESCGEFMGTGLKFNARKSFTGDHYLGIQIYRFRMRCKGCPASFSIRTDPKNSDYQCESGVKRNFEPWREAEELQQKADEERDEQKKSTIEALESKTQDAKQQMEELDALDHIKSLNAKRAKINVDDVLASYKANTDGLSAADEESIHLQVRATLNGREKNLRKPNSSSDEKGTIPGNVLGERVENNDSAKTVCLFKSPGVKVKIRKRSPPQAHVLTKASDEEPDSSARNNTAESALVNYGPSDSSSSGET